MLTTLGLVLISNSPTPFPIAIWMLFGIAIWLPLISIAARKSQMQKAGTWMGFGSIACEDRWNGGKGKNREGMLLAAGIGKDDPEHAALLGLKWADLPVERRQQVFEKSPWGPKVKKGARK